MAYVENPAALAACGASETDHASELIGSENRSLASETQPSKSWRDVLPVHPAADLLPMMTEAELKVLGEDIKQNGLAVPIVVHTKLVRSPGAADRWEYSLLDGRNRLDAIEMVGISPVRVGRAHRTVRHDCGLSGDLNVETSTFIQAIQFESVEDPWAFVLSANLWRRHLNGEQRRDLIGKVLKATPQKSNNAIAKQVKADDKTVASVRRDLEARSEIPNVQVRTDTKGRAQPATKPKLEKASVISEPGPDQRPSTSSRSAAKPEILKSGPQKALAEFKVAVDVWFAKMGAAEKAAAAEYAVARAVVVS